MKLILILSIICMNLISYEYEFSGSAKAEINMLKMHGDNPESEIFTNSSIILYNDFTYENVIVNISPYVRLSSSVYNNVINEYAVNMRSFGLHEASISYAIDEIMVTVGVVSFSDGNFIYEGGKYQEKGNGLSLITNLTLEGTIITAPLFDDFYTSFGYFFKNKYVNSHEQNGKILKSTVGNDYDFSDSKGKFIIVGGNKNNHSIELNIWNYDSYINSNYISTNMLMGLAYSYRIDETVYYGTVAHSRTKGDSTPMSPLGFQFSNNNYSFGEFDVSGTAILAGISKTEFISFIDRDMSFNFEYYRSNKGFHSMLLSEPYSSYGYADYGDSYTIRTTVNMSDMFRVTVGYKHHRTSGDELKGGGVVVTGKTKLMDDANHYTNTDTISVEIQYDF